MAKSVQDYLGLITSEYTKQPNFNATVAFMVALQVRVQQLMDQMTGPLFDLSTPPVGDQLDILGLWVGASRQVTIPLQGVFFTWDGTTTLGWDSGSWQPAGNPTSITSLPDDAYLTLILATIAANNWDGTTTGAYKVWDDVFPQFKILIQDNCNMTYELAVIGGVVDAITVALISGGYIHLRPEGVRVDAYFVSVDTNPAFCWDSESTLVKGWDEGSWLKQI